MNFFGRKGAVRVDLSNVEKSLVLPESAIDGQITVDLPKRKDTRNIPVMPEKSIGQATPPEPAKQTIYTDKGIVYRICNCRRCRNFAKQSK
jgi:hypothetical protein